MSDFNHLSLRELCLVKTKFQLRFLILLIRNLNMIYEYNKIFIYRRSEAFEVLTLFLRMVILI